MLNLVLDLLQYPIVFGLWWTMEVVGPAPTDRNSQFPDLGTYATFVAFHLAHFIAKRATFSVLFLPYTAYVVTSMINTMHNTAYRKYVFSLLLLLTDVWRYHQIVTFLIVHLFVYDTQSLLRKLRGTPVKYLHYMQYIKYCVAIYSLVFLQTAYIRISTTAFLVAINFV